MAIKERKQITGTTAQIQDYAGHEGQIVWDKDKKTFVGMSGTAGKNYPLATQTYVDTKSLPLTGGNMTGELTLNNLGRIAQETSPELDQILFQAYDRTDMSAGGWLACRGHSGSNEADHGSFSLGVRSKDGSITYQLLGNTAGGLSWAGKEVERADGFYAAQFVGGYCDVHRYVTGLQILTAGFQIPSNQIGVTLTFTRPFINLAYSVVANGHSPNGDVAITYDSDTTTSIRFCRKSYTGAFDFTLDAKCIIVGRWW